MEMKNKETYKNEFLKTLNEYLEETKPILCTEILKTKDGYLILWSDNKELDEISNYLKIKGFEDLPKGVEARYSDEVVLCDCCRKILELTPQHAFWQPDYLRTKDGEYYCSDCLSIEDILEEYNNDFSRCLYASTVPETKMKEFGFENYALIMKNNSNHSNNHNDGEKTILSECLETSFLNAKTLYDTCVVYCYTSTPFELELTIFVKDKKEKNE